MPQLFPNPISSNSYITVSAGAGLVGGGQVSLGGTVSLALNGGTSSLNARNNYAVSPTPDGTISEFTIVNAAVPLPAYVDVFINGKLQDSNTYILGTNTISFQNGTGTLPPPSGAKIFVVYSVNSTRTQYTLSSIGGSTTNYGFPSGVEPDSSYVDVFVAGVFQDTTAYSLNYSSGSWEIVFGTAQTSTDIVAVFDPFNFSTRNIYNVTPNSSTTIFTIQGGTPTSLYVDTFVSGLFQDNISTYSLNINGGVWQLAFASAVTGSNISVVF